MTTWKSLALAIAGWLCCCALSPSSVQGEDKPVKIQQQFSGSVADATLAQNAPAVIGSSARLEKLWAQWKLKGDVPKIDFAKQLVVLVTTPGSHIHLSCKLSEDGDLKVIGMATLDFGEGFRYIIAAVNREGVKTVEGKKLPEE